MPRGGPVGALVVLAGLALTSTALAPAAGAHDGRSVVRLAVDGADGSTTVHALLVYRGDGQPVVDEYVLAELTSEGRTRSFQVRPSPRVPGEFASTAHLADGHWRLVVSAKAATTGSASGDFDVVGGRPTDMHLSASFTPARHGTPTASGGSTLPWLALGVLTPAFLVAVVLLSARRVRRTTPDPGPGGRGAAREWEVAVPHSRSPHTEPTAPDPHKHP
jgi:hypothetical protein